MANNDIHEIHRKLDVLIERSEHLVKTEDCFKYRENHTKEITKIDKKISRVFWSFTAIISFITIAVMVSGFVVKVWK